VTTIQQSEAIAIVGFWHPIFAYFEANPNPVFMEIFLDLESRTVSCLKEIILLFEQPKAT